MSSVFSCFVRFPIVTTDMHMNCSLPMAAASPSPTFPSSSSGPSESMVLKEPIQWIYQDRATRAWTVNPKARQALEAIREPVAVLSIAG
jgi:hypothetical protein